MYERFDDLAVAHKRSRANLILQADGRLAHAQQQIGRQLKVIVTCGYTAVAGRTFQVDRKKGRRW